MANCGVLESHQKPTDRPRRRMKRSGGISLVEVQGKAEWIIFRVLLRMFPENASRPIKSVRLPAPALTLKQEIPEYLEPVIDKRLGVRFEDPVKGPQMPRFRRIWRGEKYSQPLLPNGMEATF